MKAIILAAGLGTRLRPYSLHTPKPLFSINQRPCISILMEQLAQCGCSLIIVNTHYHHEQIETCIAQNKPACEVAVRYEPEILGTGGAVRNVADLWHPGPLLVVNADIVTDINFAQVFSFHLSRPAPVTMVMHDFPKFNSVWVGNRAQVISFDAAARSVPKAEKLAFTGIHVLDGGVLDFLPEHGFADIIDGYRQLLSTGQTIDAFIAENRYWQDIGSPEGYRRAAVDLMAPAAFDKAFGRLAENQIVQTPLQGDGSDRHWYRLYSGPDSLILSDHGIRGPSPQQEVDAFVAIGKHLKHHGIDVPAIVSYDCFAGLVFLEDLGDLNLQTALKGRRSREVQSVYQDVIDAWAAMAVDALEGFDPAWTYQSHYYDRALILEKECRYFCEAFLQSYLGWAIPYDALAGEFNQLAEGIEQTALQGFLHRDLQSRNIMLKNGRPFFIDFQGARLGPVQYDLASLLIDPYADLQAELREHLKTYAGNIIRRRRECSRERFETGFDYCCLTRNLQILGAFSFLSRIKGKHAFEAYIPAALQTLVRSLSAFRHRSLPELTKVARRAARQIATK